MAGWADNYFLQLEQVKLQAKAAAKQEQLARRGGRGAASPPSAAPPMYYNEQQQRPPPPSYPGTAAEVNDGAGKGQEQRPAGYTEQQWAQLQVLYCRCTH